MLKVEDRKSILRAVDEALRPAACASVFPDCTCSLELPQQLARVPPMQQILLPRSERRNTLTAASLPRKLRSSARTLLRNVSLLSEALTFRVVCPGLGPGVVQVAPLLTVHDLRLLFRVSVLPRETQYFAERVRVKPASECQDLPDLLRAAHFFQVHTPPLLFLGQQEVGKGSLRKLRSVAPSRFTSFSLGLFSFGFPFLGVCAL